MPAAEFSGPFPRGQRRARRVGSLFPVDILQRVHDSRGRGDGATDSLRLAGMSGWVVRAHGGVRATSHRRLVPSTDRVAEVRSEPAHARDLRIRDSLTVTAGDCVVGCTPLVSTVRNQHACHDFWPGYVGLVTGACLAETGNHGVMRRHRRGQGRAAQAGDIPIYEPGLDRIVENGRQSRGASSSPRHRCRCCARSVPVHRVGTPPGETARPICRTWSRSRARSASTCSDYRIIVDKSTGALSARPICRAEVQERLNQRPRDRFRRRSNPEFLKEGAAVRTS